MSDLDLDQFLSYCKHFSNFPEYNDSYKHLIEEFIIQTGLKIFNNNFSKNSSHKKKLFLVVDKNCKYDSNFSEKYQNIYYFKEFPIKEQERSYSNRNFIKFLKVFFKHSKNFLLIFISHSPLLKETEVVLNIYNLEDLDNFAEFLNFENLFNSLDLNIINYDDHNKYNNHLTFLSSLAKRFLLKNKLDNNIYDLVINQDISSDKIQKVLLKLQKVLKSTI